MPEEDNSSDVADMEASEKEGACILERFLSIRCVGSSLVARGDKGSFLQQEQRVLLSMFCR